MPKPTPEEIAKRNADKAMQLKKNDFIRKMLKTSKEEFNRLILIAVCIRGFFLFNI